MISAEQTGRPSSQGLSSASEEISNADGEDSGFRLEPLELTRALWKYREVCIFVVFTELIILSDYLGVGSFKGVG